MRQDLLKEAMFTLKSKNEEELIEWVEKGRHWSREHLFEARKSWFYGLGAAGA